MILPAAESGRSTHYMHDPATNDWRSFGGQVWRPRFALSKKAYKFAEIDDDAWWP